MSVAEGGILFAAYIVGTGPVVPHQLIVVRRHELRWIGDRTMRDTKITILGVSVLLSGLIINSMSLASEISVDCSYTPDKKTSFCTTNNEGDERLWRCDKQRNGTWKCGEVPTAQRLSSDVEPGLKGAVIDAVKQAMKSEGGKKEK